MTPKLVAFAGQGSQYIGMGGQLFSKYSSITQTASELLGYDIAELCIHDPEGNLNKTQYTQPALFTVNALRWMDQCNRLDHISYFIGHSLGEYNALLAADVFDFATGLRLVQERARLMGEARGGAMAAVIKIPHEQIENYLQQNGLGEIEIANYNTRQQHVISGPQTSIQEAIKMFQGADVMVVPLNVSAAFHSSHMIEASKAFRKFIKEFDFNPPATPVISNVTARPYKEDDISDLLYRQIKAPVKWSESIRYLMAVSPGFDYHELGKRPVVSKMIDFIKSNDIALDLEEENSKATAKTKTKPASVSPNKTVSYCPGEQLGAKAFKERYGIKYAYIAGGMYRGISSKELVVSMANERILSFLGTGGMTINEVKSDIEFIQNNLAPEAPYGINVVYNLHKPEEEMRLIELLLEKKITCIEASAFMTITLALAYFRIKGIYEDHSGKIKTPQKVIAKLSRPEVTNEFMRPPSQANVKKLLEVGKITRQEAELANKIPMSSDICLEADSGGHTDLGNPLVLFPSIKTLKDKLERQYKYSSPVHIGIAGGIGTPQSAASAFTMGADFILTGSINQCTIEAGISDAVKDLLYDINIQDTAYAPAGDMFEIGAKVQVLKRGVLFPARANKLYLLYQQYQSLEEIPKNILRQLEEKYFKKTILDVWSEIQESLTKKGDTERLQKALSNPKEKMALVFRWYFKYTSQLAFSGRNSDKVNFQIHTGPALGAFNQWVQGTEMESWRKRSATKIAEKIMKHTSQLLKTPVAKPEYKSSQGQASPLAVNFLYPQEFGKKTEPHNNLGLIHFSNYESDRLEYDKSIPFLRVNVEERSDSIIEQWTSATPVQYIQKGGFHFASNENILFGAVTIKEHFDKDALAKASEECYVNIFDHVNKLGYPNIFRMWNYIPGINTVEASRERYKSFCLGRSNAFQKYYDNYNEVMPAATGISKIQAGGIDIYFLSCRDKLINIENPRQTPAYKYPIQYGPQPPSFARATYIKHNERDSSIYISGTASVIGSQSKHIGDITRQCDVTLENIKHLIGAENLESHGIVANFDLTDVDAIKIYYRHHKDLTTVKYFCERAFSSQAQKAYIQSDVCRSDLLVEIEGVINWQENAYDT